MAFVGDGLFVGDGGSHLQALWEKWTWTPINNCPGRYVCKERATQLLTPQQVNQLVGVGVTPVECEVDALRDKCVVTIFPGGGGVISYAKPQEHRFVHTLNTTSGMQRKLEAVGLAHLLAQQPNG